MDYRKRMTEYYPQVLRDCRDMQGIIFTEYPEFEEFASYTTSTVDEAFLDTMSKDRIAQWEKLLGIPVSSDASVEDRRSVVIGKLTDPGKLDESVIKEIVQSMTNGTAELSFSDGTLHVEITPGATDGKELYPEIDRELSQRLPAHIRLDVSRDLLRWSVVKNWNASWGEVKKNYPSWRYVKTIYPPEMVSPDGPVSIPPDMVSPDGPATPEDY